MNNPPREYKPTALRPKRGMLRPLRWGVYSGDKVSGFRQHDGPFFKLKDALESLPGKFGDYVILRLNENGSNSVMYKWDTVKEAWVMEDIAL